MAPLKTYKSKGATRSRAQPPVKDTRSPRSRYPSQPRTNGKGVKRLSARDAAAAAVAASDTPIVIESDSEGSRDRDEDGHSEDVEESRLPVLPRASVGPTTRGASRIARASTTEPLTPKARFSGLCDQIHWKAATTTKKAKPRTPSPSGLAGKNAATASTSVASQFQRSTPSTAKVTSSPIHQSASSVKVLGLADHGSLHSHSTPASSGSSRLNASKIIAMHSKRTALGSSPSLPSSLPTPAVKSRIYSESRPSSQRKTTNGSKSLQSFRFVPATSLLAQADTINPVHTTATTLTVMSNSKLNPPFRSHNTSKPIKQEGSSHTEPLQVQSNKNKPSSKATRSTLTATATRGPKLEEQPVLGPALTAITRRQSSNLLPSPQTPENAKAVKQITHVSSSAGSRADPYSIFSDSDSDDTDNDDDTITQDYHHNLEIKKNENTPNPSPLKSLGSFAEIPSSCSHETASDVEAVLNQYPSWLDTPSPATTRHHRDLGIRSTINTPTATGDTTSTITSSVRTAPPAWPAKRLWNDGDGRKSNLLKSVESTEGKGKRRVRFSEDDGDAFSPSPLPPAKRIAIKKESQYPNDGGIASSWSSSLPASSLSSSFTVRQPSATTSSILGSDPVGKIPLPSSLALSLDAHVNVDEKPRVKKDGPEVIVVASDSDSDSDLDLELETESKPEPEPSLGLIPQVVQNHTQKRDSIVLVKREKSSPLREVKQEQKEGEGEQLEMKRAIRKKNRERKRQDKEKAKMKKKMRKMKRERERDADGVADGGDEERKGKRKKRKRRESGGMEKAACRHRVRRRLSG